MGGLSNFKETTRRNTDFIEEEALQKFGFDVFAILEYDTPNLLLEESADRNHSSYDNESFGLNKEVELRGFDYV